MELSIQVMAISVLFSVFCPFSDIFIYSFGVLPIIILSQLTAPINSDDNDDDHDFCRDYPVRLDINLNIKLWL